MKLPSLATSQDLNILGQRPAGELLEILDETAAAQGETARDNPSYKARLSYNTGVRQRNLDLVLVTAACTPAGAATMPGPTAMQGRHCEARSWHAWHRHVSLVMTALAFLAKLRADLLRSTATGVLPSKRNERSSSVVALASSTDRRNSALPFAPFGIFWPVPCFCAKLPSHFCLSGSIGVSATMNLPEKSTIKRAGKCNCSTSATRSMVRIWSVHRSAPRLASAWRIICARSALPYGLPSSAIPGSSRP
jgi:hypothetical protein